MDILEEIIFMTVDTCDEIVDKVRRDHYEYLKIALAARAIVLMNYANCKKVYDKIFGNKKLSKVLGEMYKRKIKDIAAKAGPLQVYQLNPDIVKEYSLGNMIMPEKKGKIDKESTYEDCSKQIRKALHIALHTTPKELEANGVSMPIPRLNKLIKKLEDNDETLEKKYQLVIHYITRDDKGKSVKRHHIVTCNNKYNGFLLGVFLAYQKFLGEDYSHTIVFLPTTVVKLPEEENLNEGLMMGCSEIDIQDDMLSNGYPKECVYTYILETYKNDHNIKIDKNSLYDILHGLPQPNETKMDRDFSKGVSINMVQRFCEKFRITHRVIDSNRKEIFTYHPENRNHTKALYYCCMNNHLYPLLTKAIKKITNGALHDYHANKKSNIELVDNLWDHYAKVSRKGLVNPRSLVVGAKKDGVYELKSFYYNNNIIKEKDKVWESIKANNNIIYDSLHKYVGSLGLSSKLNSEAAKFLNCNKRAIVKRYEESMEIINSAELKALDINKCRWSCMCYGTANWYLYDAVDCVEEFNPLNSLRDGWYKIIEWEKYGLSCDVISASIARILIKEEGMEYSNIRLQFIPRVVVAAENLRGELRKLKLNDVERKYLGCRIPGMCGKRKLKRKRAKILSSWEDVVRDVGLGRSFDTVTINGKAYYITFDVVIQDMDKTGWSFYLQVLDSEWIRLRHLKSQIYGTILACKTDCVVFQGDYSTEHISNTASRFKLEPNPTLPLKQVSWEPVPYELKVVETRNIRELSLSESCLRKPSKIAKEIISSGKSTIITGLAGTGKTEILKAMVTRFTELSDKSGKAKKIKVISPSNIAAVLCGGETIHKGLKFVNSTLVANFPNIDVLMIDELSQINVDLWNVIQLFIDVKKPLVYVFGCPYQLPPVSGTRFNVMPYLKVICDDHIELTVCKRSDTRLFELFNKVLLPDTTDVPYVIRELYNDITSDRAICRTNKTRIAWNKRIMSNLLSEAKEKGIIVSKSKIEGVAEYSQKAFLTIGCPVIPLISNNYKKNEPMTISCLEPLKAISDITHTEYEINFDEFIVNYCSTGYRVQGMTWDFPYHILEWEGAPVEFKYTAISRGKKLESINIYQHPP